MTELKYTYEKGEKYLIGHLGDYPEYLTQGENIHGLEDYLREIYSWIQDGVLHLTYVNR